MAQGLLLIDLQNDYYPGGAMELPGIEDASVKAASLLKLFRNQQLPTFHIQHIELDPEAEFFLPDSDGAKLHNDIKPQSSEKIIQKNNPNSFLETNLLDELKNAGISELIICGAMSYMCIDATARAALDLGFNCTVVHDACATCDLDFYGTKIPAAQAHGAFMRGLEDAGCSVVDLKSVL